MSVPPTSYRPVNVCIYCGAPDELTDEHIIPFGLGGHFVLPKSSCKRCATETSKVELAVLRRMMGLTRARLGIKGRRAKAKPSTRPLGLGKDESGRYVSRGSVEIPVSDLPLVFVGMVLRAPTILSGQPASEAVNGTPWYQVNAADAKKFMPNDKDGMDIGEFHAGFFCRMIAKIAHSFVVAERGLESFTPLLPDLILGRSNTACHWIGGPPVPLPPADPKGGHKVELIHIDTPKGIRYVGANVRLFAQFGAPEYAAVVGIDISSGKTNH